MICPKCKIEMKNGVCLRCGYMESGNVIKTESKMNKKFEDIKLFNQDFDSMYRNENGLIAMFLGNFYLSYHGHLLIGVLCGILDFMLFCLTAMWASKFYFSFVMYYAIAFYFLVTRILYGAMLNTVCLKLDELKIKVIKRIYKTDYKKKLIGHNKSVVYVFLNILIYVVFISILIIIRRIENGTL